MVIILILIQEIVFLVHQNVKFVMELQMTNVHLAKMDSISMEILVKKNVTIITILTMLQTLVTSVIIHATLVTELVPTNVYLAFFHYFIPTTLVSKPVLMVILQTQKWST